MSSARTSGLYVHGYYLTQKKELLQARSSVQFLFHSDWLCCFCWIYFHLFFFPVFFCYFFVLFWFCFRAFSDFGVRRESRWACVVPCCLCHGQTVWTLSRWGIWEWGKWKRKREKNTLGWKAPSELCWILNSVLWRWHSHVSPVGLSPRFFTLASCALK